MTENRFEQLLSKLTSGNISNPEQDELLKLIVTSPIPAELRPNANYQDVDVRLMEKRKKTTKPKEVRLVSPLSDESKQ